jgi:hypothetical protein
MSQWGEKRRFVSANAEITVLPNVNTGEDPFAPINLESVITSLHVSDAKGSSLEINQLEQRLNEQYIGRPYAEWRRPGPPRPLPQPAPMSGGPLIHVSSHTGARTEYPERDMNKFSNAGYRGMVDIPPCKIRIASDTTYCAADGCGLRWDTNDPEPPGCPHSRVSLARLGRDAQRRIAPYSEPQRRHTGLLPVYLSFAAAVAALGWRYWPNILYWLGL